MYKKLTLTIIFIIVAAAAFSQVFPEEEFLDVVRVTDGSVLKGRIVEDQPDEYLAIELYGGSVFTVAYANIQSVSEQRNPDYQTTYLRLQLGDFTAEAEPTDVPAEDDGVVEDAGDTRWPNPTWVWPVSLGAGGMGGFNPYVQAGGARRVGSALYAGALVHVFFEYPYPVPLLMVGYGRDPGRFLILGSFVAIPPDTIAGDSWFTVSRLSVAINRISAHAFVSSDTTFGGGIGYIF
ncbi:MAG: hypothetical protein PF508_05925 [Spirochaeta sp.]|jgi:hypothetical protein|nr:hypothetical protein [Spirochaeta sp.]